MTASGFQKTGYNIDLSKSCNQICDKPALKRMLGEVKACMCELKCEGMIDR